MTSQKIKVGVAVAASLAVVALFFVFANPFLQINPFASSAAAQNAQQLVVQDEAVGSGAEALPGSLVTIHYTGKLENGTVFDTSVGRDPYQFVLGAGQVIAGFDQGLQGMKEGGKRLLIIPPQLGYGADAYGPIPSNSTLIFEVQLLKVEKQPNSILPATNP